jgi:hypothetical protein
MIKKDNITQFETNNSRMLELIEAWEPRLLALPEDVIASRRNKQNRNIKQILGHMVDSASNNTHRIVHLQYQTSPLVFPDYANLGNNDRWIAVQNYEFENWTDLVQLWKYANKHIVHVINQVNSEKLENIWVSALGEEVSLQAMIVGYLCHFELHLREIEELKHQS